MAHLDVTGRIACTLLRLAKQPMVMTLPTHANPHHTRQEIAKIVGCLREVAGRILKELEQNGLITGRQDNSGIGNAVETVYAATSINKGRSDVLIEIFISIAIK